MKALLEALKQELQQAAVLSYIDDADIFIVPDVEVIPYDASFPAIGLKDGPIEHVVEDPKNWEVKLQVNVVVYVLLTQGEAPVLGLFDIVDDVHSVLNDNLLGMAMSGMELAYSTGEDESRTIGYDDVVLQAKTITYEYQKHEVRP